MDGEHAKLGARWAMGLTAAAAVGFALTTVVPRAHQAFALSLPAAPLIAQVAGIGLIIGAVAGLVGWIIAAALTRTAMVARGLLFVVALAAGVPVIAVSAVGWVQFGVIIAKLPHGFIARRGATSSFEIYRSQVRADRVAYQNELKGARHSWILSFKALAEPDGLKTARTEIKQVRIIVQKYQDQYQGREIALRAGSIAAAATPAEQRAGMDRVKRVMSAEFKAREDWWQATSEIAAEQEAVLDDLANADAAWEVKDNHLIFHSKKDEAKFQGHLAKLKTLYDEAHKLDLAIAHESDKADEEMFGIKR